MNRYLDRRLRVRCEHIDRTTDARPGVIYFLRDPRDGSVVYIGQTVNESVRLRQHERKETNYKLLGLQRELKGQPLRFEVVERCFAYVLNERERHWIAYGKRHGWPLCNLTDGGDTACLVDAVKQKLSVISVGKWQDPTYRARWEAGMAKRHGLTVEQLTERKRQRIMEKAERVRRWRANMAISAQRKERSRLAAERLRRHPRIEGDVAYVPLLHSLEAMVDADDCERVRSLRWAAAPHLGQHRAKANHKGRTVLLNRFVMNARSGERVFYRNGNQLDCRKANLVVRMGAGT